MYLIKLKISVRFSLKKESYMCRMYANFKHKKIELYISLATCMYSKKIKPCKERIDTYF